MNTKLAYAIWPWGTDTKEQFTEAVRDVSEIGFRYFESVKNGLGVFEQDPEEMWRICAEYGTEPVSFYFHLTDNPEEDMADAKRKFPLLAKHGIGVISLQTMGVPGGKPSPEQRELTLQVVRQFGVLGKEYGIQPCLHPHLNTSVTFEADIDYIMENTDPSLIFMGPDTAHLKAANCDPYTVMARYVDRIRFTHFKDLRDATASAAGYQAGVEVYSNFAELGTGDVDFPPIAKLLRDHGYSGYYTAELDRSPTTNKQSAKANWAYMNKHFC